MKLLFFCPRWGNTDPYPVYFEQVRAAGYDGVEMSLPFDQAEKKTILTQLKDAGLQLIGQHWETVDADFQTHKHTFEKHLYKLVEGEPLFINSQTGKDYYTFAQNGELIDLAAEVTRQTGIRVLHETHRGKFSFAAHITKHYLEAIPDLRITLDISHWCNVAESFLDDQPEAVALAISRTDHIHTRVGFTEGPQIIDPRAPEWQEAVQTHMQWWHQIIKQHRQQGSESLTITPEFGAPPYMTLLPYTRQPLVSQWEVNLHMMHLLKENVTP